MYLLPRPRSAPCICTRWDILDISIGHVLHPSLLSFSPPTSLLPPPTLLFILASALGIVVSSPSPVHSLPRIYLIASAFGSSYLLTVHDLLPSSFNFGHIALAVTFVVVPAPRTAPPSSVHPCALFMTLRLNEYPRLPVNVRCCLRLHCMLHEGRHYLDTVCTGFLVVLPSPSQLQSPHQR